MYIYICIYIYIYKHTYKCVCTCIGGDHQESATLALSALRYGSGQRRSGLALVFGFSLRFVLGICAHSRSHLHSTGHCAWQSTPCLVFGLV
jgi:hypothetical protein